MREKMRIPVLGTLIFSQHSVSAGVSSAIIVRDPLEHGP